MPVAAAHSGCATTGNHEVEARHPLRRRHNAHTSRRTHYFFLTLGLGFAACGWCCHSQL